MLVSPFLMTAAPDVNPASLASPIDWLAFTADVTARLDVIAEFRAIGVEFTGKTWGDKHECHAITRKLATGRDDDSPSAFVNARTGVYYDSGSGEKNHLFGLAAKYGDAGDYKRSLKHYAEKAGMPLGRLPIHGNREFVEAEFDYLNADGSVAYRVWRKRLPNGKKSFSQRPPDGRGGWRFGNEPMKGVQRVPYRLSHFEDAQETYLWFTEGEVAADALVKIGLVATTNSQGSDAPERDLVAILPYFAARDVVVLPDNDDKGRKHAQRMCRLLYPVADSVRCLALPGLPVKGDAVEWIADGGTRDQLEKLADECELWTPELAEAVETKDDPASRDATLADLRTTLSADAWVWPGWMPNSALMLLAAEGGIGKTRLLMDLHRRAYNDLPWPDGQSKPAGDEPRVLWVLADGQYEQMCATAEAFGIPDEAIVLNTNAADPQGGSELQTAEQLADFEERINRVKPAWVVIDTITNTGDYKTQDAADAKRQYKPLQEIAARRHVPIVCVTHVNAAGKALGRRAVEKVRVVVHLEQPDESQGDRRKLHVSKTYSKKPEPLGVTVSESGYEYDNNPPSAPAETDKPGRKGPAPVKLDAAKVWLAERIGIGTVRVGETLEAGKEAEFSVTTLYRAFEALGGTETVSATGRGKLWSLPPKVVG